MLTDAAAVLGLQVVLQGRLKTRFYKYDFFLNNQFTVLESG